MVDTDIPVTNRNLRNVLVYVIANEHYRADGVASVEFAENDGRIFAEYAKKTLGVPAGNVRLLTNVSCAQMLAALSQMQRRARDYRDSEIIFYYAGHGVPERNGAAVYLLPVDMRAEDAATIEQFELAKLCDALADCGAKRVSIFIDACFSGMGRDNRPVIAARGVRVAQKFGQVRGNVILFSASSEDETAMPIRSRRHGVFTYCLLSKLRETRGDITYAELGRHLREEMPRLSWEANDRPQRPSISCGRDFDTTQKIGQ